mmetsp:Transcript_137217/g.333426  ORF Transcript_137217/g.333426 Transcript_137217/m.333426 type:complete len:467 (+) Transcript_137217:72-1472(+)
MSQTSPHSTPLLPPSAENGLKDKSCQSCPKGGSGTAMSCLHAVTTWVNVGSFALPWAFERLGLVLGTMGVLAAGILSWCALADLICVKGSTGYGPCGLRSRATRGNHDGIARGAALPPPGLAELTAEILGHPAGCLARLCLVLRDVGIVAAHATLAAAALQLLVEDAVACESVLGSTAPTDGKLIMGFKKSQVCGFQLWIWTALVLLAALLMSCLSPKCLACLYVVGVTALLAVAVAVVAAGALLWPQVFQMQSSLLWPPSSEGVGEGMGIIAFLYCTQFRVLPPLHDGMARPRHFGCVASGAFCVAAFANVAIGLAGGPMLDAVMGKDAKLSEEILLTVPYVRWLLWGGNMALCPAILAPAVEQTRRSLPQCPTWAVCFGLLIIAAGVAQIGTLGQIVNLAGGGLHCLTALVLPAALAIWALPWQSTGQTAVRVVVILVGIMVATGSAHAASQTLEHAVPSLLPS